MASSSSDSDSDEPLSQTQLSESCLVGFIIANIVGLRHYSGRISGREMVGLVREPLNPYDPNALKVLNTRHVQVGYIDRHVAAILAPLLDSRTLTNLEAIVPKPPKNPSSYRLPCQIHLFALPSNFPAVVSALSAADIALIHQSHPEFGLSDSVIVQERNKNSEKRSLDEIFSLVGDCTKNVSPMEPDRDVIISELLEHQKEGLGWMVGRENSTDLPPFWEKKRRLFLNVLTNFETDERPEPLKGGILADDMGLGKTLMLLSLIATNGRIKPKAAGNSRKKRKVDNNDGSTSATLVICPTSVLATWITQLEQHTRSGSLKTYLYHGGERARKADGLAMHDIVLTTNNTLASEFRSEGSDSLLVKMRWLRVILDEAHVIKNSAAQQTKAVIALEAERRWVVTGTPIQNSPSDLFALMAFLRFQPFSIKSYWQSLVQRPVGQGSKKGLSRLQALMGSISLRRLKETKDGSKSLVGLPPKVVETCLVVLSSEERETYDQMELQAKNTVNEYINSERVMPNYSTILYIILRLRQICDDMALCPDIKVFLSSSSLEDASNNLELSKKLGSMIEDDDDFDCPICLSPPTKTIITRCAHIFCQTCIQKTLKHLNPCCPICRHPLTQSDLFAVPKPKLSDDDSATVSPQGPISSKVSALLKLLHSSKQKNPLTKSVVFSQFRKMLILLEEPLRAAGFAVLRLDGSMTMKKRTEVMKHFGTVGPNSPTVLLASLKAAGAGINLTMASRVYLFEPWWNPAVEEQAMDRVHRIGQREEVRVVRLVAKDSVEERILELQERKKRLAGGVFGKKDAKEQRMMRLEDLRLMMGL